MKINRYAQAAVYILLVACAILWIYPFLWMLFSSFKTNTEFISSSANLLPKTFHWDNYIRAWITAKFSVYFRNSVIVTLSTVLIVLFLTTLAGYALGRVRFPGHRWLLLILTSSLFIPKGYTIIPIYQIIKKLNLLNTLPGVILAESSNAHVLFILLFMSFFQGLPKDLEDAAQIDGAGFIRTFIQVMLPLSRPIIATTAIMQFIFTWNSFFVPLIFTLNKPELRTLSVGMYAFTGEYSVDFTGLLAGATIALLPVLIVFLFFQKYFVDGLAGSVKG